MRTRRRSGRHSKVRTASTEAATFAAYLLGQPADRRTCELYDEAVARRAPSANDHNQRILQFALAHPRLLGALDVALALTEPGSDLRRRLLLMAAVIETQPRYAERFLSCDRSKLYPLVLLLVGLRAAARAAVGLLLLRFVG